MEGCCEGTGMKTTIRILLVLASLCMVIGNWHGTVMALSASGLFLVANLLAFGYNLWKGK
jgi:hypothetical protein